VTDSYGQVRRTKYMEDKNARSSTFHRLFAVNNSKKKEAQEKSVVVYQSTRFVRNQQTANRMHMGSEMLRYPYQQRLGPCANIRSFSLYVTFSSKGEFELWGHKFRGRFDSVRDSLLLFRRFVGSYNKQFLAPTK